MNKQFWRYFLIAIGYAFAACVLGPYSRACVSLAVFVMMLSGIKQAPGFSLISGILYLIAGIFLPVLPDWATHGATNGFGAIFGNSGGFIFVLPFLAFLMSLMMRAIRNEFLAVFAGLVSSFVLYFGIGAIWVLIKTGSVSFASLQSSMLLYLMLMILAFITYPMIRKIAKKK